MIRAKCYFDTFDVLASDTNKFRLLIKKSLFNKTWPAPVKRKHETISVKAISLRYFLDRIHCAQTCLYGIIETDEGNA